MKNAGKRITSVGLVLLLMLAFNWQVTLAGLKESYGASMGYSLGASSDDDSVSLGESDPALGSSTPMLSAAMMIMPLASVNIMTKVEINSIEEPTRDPINSRETVSVKIYLERNGQIPAGSTTRIVFPNKLSIMKTSDAISIPNVEDNNRIIAVATIEPNTNSILITATEGMDKASKVSGHVTVSAEFNTENFNNPVGDDKYQEDFVFTENGSKTITVPKTIVHQQTTGSYHMLYKYGQHTENGRIQWYTQINHYGSHETRWNLVDVEVEDSIGPGHELVPGSVEVWTYNWVYLGPNGKIYYGSPQEITDQCDTLVERSDGFTIRINNDLNLRPNDFAETTSLPYRVLYKTQVTDSTYWRKHYENSVELTATNADNNSSISRTSNNQVTIYDASAGTVAIAKLTVKKIDADTKDPLPNAVFELRNDADVTLTTLVTDSKGIAYYEGPLRVGESYWLYETHTPGSQYEPPDEPTEVILKGNEVDGEISVEVENRRATELGVLEIRKTDSEGFRLSEATFILFGDEDMTMQIEDRYENLSWTTGDGGEPGIVRIEGIPVGTYYLLETKAPPGYLIGDPNPRKVEVLSGTSGVSVVSLSNERDAFDLIVLKEDSETLERLSGAEFTAYRKSTASGNWTEVDSFTIKDKDLGYARSAIIGEYRLWENKAPEGYKLPNEYISFVITEADRQYGSYTLIVPNDPLDDDTGLASVRAYTHEENDYDSTIEGAELVLHQYSNGTWEALTDVTTGNTGLSGIIGGLPYGTYKFAPENNTPEGYTATVSQKEFVLDAKNSSSAPMIVPLPYRLKSATLEIQKYDVDNGRALSGATFTLQADGSDQFVGRVTGDDGTIVVRDIPYGSYTLWETDAPTGYYTSGYSEKIIIDQPYKTVRVPNRAVDSNAVADVRLIKYAEGWRNTFLAGAEFELEQFNEANGKWEIYLHGLRTDAQGEIYIHNLPFGDYRFVEIKAPAGYKMIGDGTHSFHLDASSGDPLTLYVANQAVLSNNNGGENVVTGSRSRDGEKGSSQRDVFRSSTSRLTPEASLEPASTELQDSSNPSTGTTAFLYRALWVLALSCTIWGGILIHTSRKEH